MLDVAVHQSGHLGLPDGPQIVARAVESSGPTKNIAPKGKPLESPRSDRSRNRGRPESTPTLAAMARIAFTPARTIEGVLAKLDAASAQLKDARLSPDDFPKGCAPEDVAWMAAADLAALRLREA